MSKTKEKLPVKAPKRKNSKPAERPTSKPIKTLEKSPEKAPKRKPAKPTVRPTSKPVSANSPKPKEENILPFYYCSFCGKSSQKTKVLITGPRISNICDECVEVCVTILAEEMKDEWISRIIKVISPKNKSLTNNEKLKTSKEDN
jgi:hypothetical protein